MEMKMQMKVLAAAISAIGMLGSVHASTQGQAILNVTNVLFYDNATNTVLDSSDFVQLPNLGGLFITDSTNLNPSVNGVFNPYANSVNGGNPLPLTVRCVAAGCPGMNSGAPFIAAVSPPTNDGAMAASSLDGNPITGLAQPSAGGADARASSLAQLTGNGTANTTASLTLASVFTFTPLNDTTVRFEFDAFKYMLAYTDSPINATSGVAWNMSIQDTSTNTEVFDWSPDGLGGGFTAGGTLITDAGCSMNDSVTAFFPASVSPGETCSGSLKALSPLLVAGKTYNLSINHQTQAVVNNLNLVPEPSSLLLAGLALAGLGVAARRKAPSAG
jgi:hypothetical protein